MSGDLLWRDGLVLHFSDKHLRASIQSLPIRIRGIVGSVLPTTGAESRQAGFNSLVLWLPACLRNLQFLLLLRPHVHLNRTIHHISCDEHRLSLAKSQCACNGLILHARVPLWLDDENAICSREIQAESTSSNCHNEHWCHGIPRKIVKNLLTASK